MLININTMSPVNKYPERRKGKIVVCGFALALALCFALYFCPVDFALALYFALLLEFI